jgi:hypothetical protein
MRRRKKAHRRSRRRLSGIGAVGNFNAEIGVILGATAGGFVNKLFAGNTTLTPKVLGVSKIVLGGILSKMSRQEMIKGVGLGMVGVGGYELVSSFGLFNGLGQADDTEMLAVSLDGIGADVLGADMDDLSTINGATDVDVVNGIGADVLGEADTDEYIM